jgi:hypothetical protein
MSSRHLAEAALFAGRAPSLHNTQPWHWYVGSDVLDLRLERRRILRESDPEGRLAVLSCGAALHHARVHLAAAGWQAEVVRIPDTEDPDLLARLLIDGPAPRDHDAIRLARAAAHRRTDRRDTPESLVDMHSVRVVRKAAQHAGADLTVLRPQQVFDVGKAAVLARGVEDADPAWQAEIAAWVGGERPHGTGIPTIALRPDPYLLTAPARALRRAGSSMITEARHHSAVFAVLHTPCDGRADWLVAGEALSAGWLTATEHGLAVLPLSIVTEVAGSRDRIRAVLGWAGSPHLVIRLAAAGAGGTWPTPRLAAGAFVSPRPSTQGDPRVLR